MIIVPSARRRIEELEAENERLLAAVATAKTERIAIYEDWLLEQKLSILELAKRLALKEGEARYYGDVDATSEDLRERVIKFANKAPGEQVTWKEVGVVEHAVNTLVYRITQQLPPEVFQKEER